MSMRLYELANQYQFLLSDLYDDETGAVRVTALDQLHNLNEPIETKCINVVKVFKDLEAEAKAIEVERKAMAAREKALKSQVDSLKEYLRFNMERCEINEIKCPQFVIKLANNPPAVDIECENLIPDEYKKVKIEFDLAHMRDDMKNGVVIPGANLIQRKSVRIR